MKRASKLSLLIVVLTACSSLHNEAQLLPVDDFKNKMLEHHKGFVVLDVRTMDEVEQGKIPGSTNLDFYGDGFEVALEKMDKETPYFVYCGGGVRSGKTAKRMSNLGFQQVYDLKGGFDAWQEAGEPIN